MPQRSARKELLRFLDERAFQPALAAQPPAYSTAEGRKLLKTVQRRVHESRTRDVADYASAADVKANVVQDLHSKPGQALASDMWQLKLTRFEDVQRISRALSATRAALRAAIMRQNDHVLERRERHRGECIPRRHRDSSAGGIRGYRVPARWRLSQN